MNENGIFLCPRENYTLVEEDGLEAITMQYDKCHDEGRIQGYRRL